MSVAFRLCSAESICKSISFNFVFLVSSKVSSCSSIFFSEISIVFSLFFRFVCSELKVDFFDSNSFNFKSKFVFVDSFAFNNFSKLFFIVKSQSEYHINSAKFASINC